MARNQYQTIVEPSGYYGSGVLLALIGVFLIGVPQFIEFGAGFSTVASVIGVLLLMLGFKYLLTREGADLDRSRDGLRIWKSFLGLKKEELIPLKDLEKVFLSSKVITHQDSEGSSSRTVYPVGVLLEGGTKVELNTFEAISRARSCAELAAKTLELSMVDTSSGAAVERDHRQLDESVGERLMRENAELKLLNPPTDSLLILENAESNPRVFFPANTTGFTSLSILFLLALGAVIGCSIWFDGVGDFLALGGGVLVLPLLGFALWEARFPRRMEIVGDRLVYRQVGSGGRTLGELPLSEIEELLVRFGRLTLRSDRKDIVVDLPRVEDADWLKLTLETMLLERVKPS